MPKRLEEYTERGEEKRSFFDGLKETKTVVEGVIYTFRKFVEEFRRAGEIFKADTPKPPDDPSR